MDIKITTLSENTANYGFLAEWGLSILVMEFCRHIIGYRVGNPILFGKPTLTAQPTKYRTQPVSKNLKHNDFILAVDALAVKPKFLGNDIIKNQGNNSCVGRLLPEFTIQLNTSSECET